MNAGFRIFITTKIRTAISSISRKFSRPKSVGLSSTFEVRTFFYNQLRSCHVSLDTDILLDFKFGHTHEDYLAPPSAAEI